jgi:hypothetical protein
MLAVSSTVSSLDLDRDDAQMVVVESNDHNDEDTVMVGVQSNADLSHTEEDDGNAVGPESIDPLGLLSDLSDMDEDDVKSQAESNFEGDSSKSKRRSMDVESLVHLAAQLEPRRSSRNIHKQNAKVNYVDYVPPPKSSRGKKKPTYENADEIFLKASLCVFHPRSQLIFPQPDSDDERPKLGNVGKAEVRFYFLFCFVFSLFY